MLVPTVGLTFRENSAPRSTTRSFARRFGKKDVCPQIRVRLGSDRLQGLHKQCKSDGCDEDKDT